jgi:hypothetical protein
VLYVLIPGFFLFREYPTTTVKTWKILFVLPVHVLLHIQK